MAWAGRVGVHEERHGREEDNRPPPGHETRYSAAMITAPMPLEQVHLSVAAETRTISDWMYMVILLGGLLCSLPLR